MVNPEKERLMPRIRPIRLIILPLAALAAAMAFAVAPASARVFANGNTITIPDKGAPNPEPIEVSGLRGPGGRLAVTLHGVTHANPEDLDVLLVNPEGQKSVLMSDVCGTGDVNRYTWSFPNVGTPPFMGDECGEVIYRATNRFDGEPDVWPFAPPGPVSAINVLTDSNPNGLWTLHVVDDSAGGGQGEIKFGWSIDIEAASPDVLVPGTGTSGPADLYPVTHTVSGLDGVISEVDVNLRGVFHERPDDIDVLLVGPQGQKVVLMSDACGTADNGSMKNFLFLDGRDVSLPDSGPCPSATYRPTDYEPGESLPSPAPAGPYETRLSAFNSTDPNGEWRLYVSDDADGEHGWIADRDSSDREPFQLRIRTRPKAKVGFADRAATLTEGQTGQLELVRTGAAGFPGAAQVTVTSAPASATSGKDFRPVTQTVEFAPGQIRKTVPVETLADSVEEGDEKFMLSIGQATGDAEPATPPTAVVTIRDPAAGPGANPGPGSRRGVDRDAPVIRRLALAPNAFRIGRRKTALAATRGTTIRYTLSEAAAVTLRFQRAVAGRRVGRACRSLNGANRRRRPCKRFVSAGTLRRAGRAGLNRVAFSGRIGRHALRPGAYRLVVTATDTAGNRSTARPRGFRIVNRRLR